MKQWTVFQKTQQAQKPVFKHFFSDIIQMLNDMQGAMWVIFDLHVNMY